jgi:hypothetical protein
LARSIENHAGANYSGHSRDDGALEMINHRIQMNQGLGLPAEAAV